MEDQTITKAVYLDGKEVRALDFIRERLPLQKDYQELLALIKSQKVNWGNGAVLLQNWLTGSYRQGIFNKSGNDVEKSMELLNDSVEGFSSEVQELFPQLDAAEYAQKTKENVFLFATHDLYTKINTRGGKMEEEVTSNQYSSEDDIFELNYIFNALKVFRKKAGLEENITDEHWGKLARYGILRAGKAISSEKDVAANKKLKGEAYRSLTLAKSTVGEIEDEDLRKELNSNISSLEKNLEGRLKIDKKEVQEYITEDPSEKEKNNFIKEYKREITGLEQSNERLMKLIYLQEEEGNTQNWAERYQLIVNLFKEALLNEAVGNDEKARGLCSDIDGEFEDFNEVMEDPRLLLKHYQDFHAFCKNLGITLEEDRSGQIKEKIERYQAAQKGKAKGILGKLFGGNDNSVGFIQEETLDGVMVSYQNRFTQDRVKTQIMLSDRKIKDQEKAETIFKACVTGLMLAKLEKGILNDWGIVMKEGETYSRKVFLQNPDYVDKVTQIGTQIQEVSDKLTGKTKKGEHEKLQKKLKNLQHAMYELRSKATSRDESQLDGFKKAVASGQVEEKDLVQVATTLTEKDIGGVEGLTEDTFIQHVTTRLAGKGIIAPLDVRIRQEGRTSYDVEKAWQEVKAAIPAFEEMEKKGIALLADKVGGAFLEESNPGLLVNALVGKYFGNHEERTTGKKLIDLFRKGMNTARLLKAKQSEE